MLLSKNLMLSGAMKNEGEKQRPIEEAYPDDILFLFLHKNTWVLIRSISLSCF